MGNARARALCPAASHVMHRRNRGRRTRIKRRGRPWPGRAPSGATLVRRDPLSTIPSGGRAECNRQTPSRPYVDPYTDRQGWIVRLPHCSNPHRPRTWGSNAATGRQQADVRLASIHARHREERKRRRDLRRRASGGRVLRFARNDAERALNNPSAGARCSRARAAGGRSHRSGGAARRGSGGRAARRPRAAP
jgi:hypothetical protein